jgi:predicted nucleotidyltransferase
MRLTPDQQRRIEALCQRYRVRQLRPFGSAAEGRERIDSDVDLLVEFAPGQAPSAFELVDLRDALSQVFGGRPVDLAFNSVLDNPYRRRAIEPQLRPLFPAVSRARRSTARRRLRIDFIASVSRRPRQRSPFAPTRRF